MIRFIDVRIEFETPVHLGASERPEPIARDWRGRPCLRAPTLKGLHRAATEQIAAALMLPVCDAPLAQNMCHAHDGQAPCFACRIFGSPWLPGKLYYADLIASEAPTIEKRTRITLSRRRQVRVAIHEQEREALPAGAIFTGQISHLLNDDALLGLALAGLRSITAMGAECATGHGLCRVEAHLLDSSNRPVDERNLAAALQRLQQSQSTGRDQP